MRIRKRMVLPLALALGALGMMVMATAASATHPRPDGCKPAAGIDGACVQRVRSSEPHARAAAGVPVV